MRFAQSRPQGFVPPRSSLQPRSVSAAHRSMLPWVLGRHVPMLPRVSALPRPAGLSPASKPARRPHDPNVEGKAKCFGFVWLRRRGWLLTRRSEAAGVGARDPKAARSVTVLADPRRAPQESIASWLRLLPKEGPRPRPNHPKAARTQSGSTRRQPTHRPGSPEGDWFPMLTASHPRRDASQSGARPRRGRRGSSSCSPFFRGCPRTTGEPARRRLPTPEGIGRPRATRRSHPEGCCVEPGRATPEGIAAAGEPVGHPRVVR